MLYSKFFKRFMDILLSIIALILLTPLFTVVAILIKIDSKGPIFFRQERYGKDKKVFTIYKFRTMYIDTPSQVATRDLDNAKEHISKIGRFLRNTSIDELPQIFNVLAGHMSLIGPRPVVLTEYEQIEEREKYGANSIRPGMSGLAQINGRDFLDVKTKAMYDGMYASNMNFLLDFKIFFKTLYVTLLAKNIAEGPASSTVYHVENAETNQEASEGQNVTELV